MSQTTTPSGADVLEVLDAHADGIAQAMQGRSARWIKTTEIEAGLQEFRECRTAVAALIARNAELAQRIDAINKAAVEDSAIIEATIVQAKADMDALAAENMALRETVAEYLAARADYNAATDPPNSHAMPPRVSPSDPRIVRYREASAALASTVSCGTCMTPIQPDPMTGTTCACAPTK